MLPQTSAARFADRHGFPLDVRAHVYADLFLREQTRRLPIPQLPFWYREPAGLWLPLSCALAQDSKVSGGNNSGGNVALNFNFNNVAGDIVYVWCFSTGGTMTSIAYNGVPMSLADSATNGYIGWLYYLTGPATGTHQVAILNGTAVYLTAVAVSYSGAAASGQPEDHNIASGFSAALSCAVTTVTDNAWLVGGAFAQGSAIGGGTGTTLRQVSDGSTGIIDSNAGIHPAGSASLVATCGGDQMAMVVSAMKPAGGGGVGGGGAAAGPLVSPALVKSLIGNGLVN